MEEENIKECFFPVMLNLTGKKILVVGGGIVGERKVFKLLEFGANITVISPEVTKKIKELSNDGLITVILKECSKDDIKDFSLIFIATNNQIVNETISKECQFQKINYCRVDNNWKDSSFITPASFRKENITVAISTNGDSCTRSKEIKNKIREILSNF